MKQRTIFSLIAFCVMFTFTNSMIASNNDGQIIAKGDTHTIQGEYTITELDPETIKGEILRKFELTYQNAKAPVIIYLNDRSKCKEYIVRNNTLEVKYTCRKSGFGAEFLYGKFALYSLEANAMFISEKAMEGQKKLSNGDLDVNKALGLIACYYPALFKNPELL